MTRFLLLLLFILLKLSGIGQDLKGVKSIIQYEDTIVRRVSSLDTNGNVTFWKNNRMNGPVILLGASYFNHINQRIMTISGHSNVGFSVWTYEFDSAGNEIRVYAYKEPPEDEDQGYRFNPYAHIENFTTAQDLENDTTVLTIINSTEKYLVFERTFDPNGNELQEILFEDNGDTAQITTNEYDKNGNRVHFSFNGTLGEWVYYYSFDTKGNELSSRRVNDKGDTTEVDLYKYDKDNNRIENQYLNKREIQYIEKYFFENRRMTKKEIYNSSNKLVRVQTFEYDNKGNVVKENYHDIDDNKKKVYIWKYEFY